MKIRSLIGIIALAWLTACSSTATTQGLPENSKSSIETMVSVDSPGAKDLSSVAEMVARVSDTDFSKRESGTVRESGGTETFYSRATGFTITKPAGWTHVVTESQGESEGQIRFTGKDLDQIVREQANAPLVFMTKHPEPYDDINPGVQVMIRHLGTLSTASPTDILRSTVARFPATFENFAFVEEVQETQVNGWKAAYTKIQYTITGKDGRRFPTLTRFWMIPRGKYMFTIGMSGAQEGPELSEEDFQRVLNSIRIGPEGPRWMARIQPAHIPKIPALG